MLQCVDVGVSVGVNGDVGVIVGVIGDVGVSVGVTVCGCWCGCHSVWMLVLQCVDVGVSVGVSVWM